MKRKGILLFVTFLLIACSLSSPPPALTDAVAANKGTPDITIAPTPSLEPTATAYSMTNTRSSSTVGAGEQKSSPVKCDAEVATQVITGFLDAFNQGNQERIAHFLDLDHLERFVVVGSKNDNHVTEINTESDGVNRDELLAYFAKRHQRHERLSLVRQQANVNRPPNLIVVTYELDRRADDLKVATAVDNIVGGKAQINCKKQKIIAWVMDGQKYIEGP
jgi:hypothetical protein